MREAEELRRKVVKRKEDHLGATFPKFHPDSVGELPGHEINTCNVHQFQLGQTWEPFSRSHFLAI